MKAQRLLGRVMALQLLIALPAVTSARVTLDARWTLDTGAHVEVEHCKCSANAHDHRLCALLSQNPWSTSPAAPRVTLTTPPAEPAPDLQSPARRIGAHRFPLARSPPS